MSLYSPLPAFEVLDSLKEKWDSGVSASVQLMTPWALRHDVAADLLWNSRPWPGISGGIVQPPTAASVGIKGFNCVGSVGQCILPEFALLDVQYSMDIVNLVSETLQPIATFNTLDHKAFRWESQEGPTLLEAEAPGRLVRGMNLVRTLYKVPGPLPPEILTLVGSVNEATYTSSILGLTFAPETLLYTPPSLKRTISNTGTEGWDITMNFQLKEAPGWNSYWRAATSSYEQIYNYKTGDVQKSYVPRDQSVVLF